MGEIDWKTELKKIEREFDGLPPEPSPEELRARRLAATRTQQARQTQNATLLVWARLLLVLALTSAVSFWPYFRACGFGLFAYLAAAGMIVLAGLWVSIYGWYYRMPIVHGFALGMVVWGGILIAAQVLPRNGYARVDPNHPPRWTCTT
jgi:hypothetical protein